jgi:hypothetical protein
MENELLPSTIQDFNINNYSIKILKWFLPAGIIVAFFVGIGSAGLCLLFCSPTTIETIFIWIALGCVVAALIYVPIISAKMISQATTKRGLVLQTLGLTIIGYGIVFGITLGWLSISSQNPNGWEPSLNERMLGWIETTVGKVQDLKREKINKAMFNESSFKFTPTSSEVSLINSNDSMVTISGTFSGLNSINGANQNYQYNLVISEIIVGDLIAQGEESNSLAGKHGTLGSELWTNSLSMGGGDTQNVTASATFPKEFAQELIKNPKTSFKINLELLALSPQSYKGFNFTSVWSQQVEFTPKYIGQFLKDPYRGINYKLPDNAVKFTKVDEKGNFVTESDNQASFTVTTNPKMSLCCEMPVFKVIQGGNNMSAEDYLNNVPWRNEIISKKLSKPGSFQMGIIEANPTIASPYKAFVFSRYGEVTVVELTGRNSGLDDLYKLYLESYKETVPFEF